MKPFSYQQEALNALATARTRGQRKALVVMATGLGKTAVSAFEIQRLLAQAPGRVLYLCHNNEILRQARGTFEEVLGASRTYGYFHGTEKHMHHVDVLFASFQTMATWREAFHRNEFRYIIIDEFHHAHATTFRPTVEYFRPDFMVGLTATPERKDGLDVTELLGRPVYQLGLFKALALGYLCQVDYRLMTDEIQNLRVLDTPIGKLSIAELNRTVFIPKRDEEIARIIQAKTAKVRNPRVMIFCASIEHAERMARLLPHAAVIHSKLQPDEKDRRMKSFRRGLITTVITVDMLNEGVDVPEANVLVFLRSTTSRTVYLQQFGRGLRKAKGKLSVLVLDFVANCERIEMIDWLQQGVRRIREELGEKVATGGHRFQPLTLTLDGMKFDERVWKVLDVIRRVRTGLTPELMIQQLRDLGARLKRTPTAVDVRTASEQGLVATQSTYARTFGSLNAALGKAGFKPNRIVVGGNRAQLMEQLRFLARHVGHIPNLTELEAHRKELGLASGKLFKKEFGSFDQALLAAGMSREDDEKKRIVRQLQALAKKLGKDNLTKGDADKGASQGLCPHSTTIIAKFGSWSAAKEAAGFERLKQAPITPAEALKKLQALSRQYSPLTTQIIDQAQSEGICPKSNYFTRHFGSVEEACKRAGVAFRSGKHRQTDELKAQLVDKTRKLGRLPTAREVAEDPNMAAYGTFRSVFRASSWEEVLRAAGLL